MEDREKALKIIADNERIIRERLFTDGYMFDDELNESMVSSVTRELAACIEEYFHLEQDQYVIRSEIYPETRSNGVLYFSECELEHSEVLEIAKQHYDNEVDFIQ